MSKDSLEVLQDARHNAKLRFHGALESATTTEELLTAYATYCGCLDGLLDLVEIQEMCRRKKDKQ